MSRAIGDFKFKLNPLLPPIYQALSADPSIKTFEIGPNSDFILMGSDGLWADTPTKEITDFVYKRLRYFWSKKRDPGGEDVREIVAELIGQVSSYRSEEGVILFGKERFSIRSTAMCFDNITVTLIVFRKFKSH
jgi:serine/threonine protein phosphatase PrpC